MARRDKSKDIFNNAQIYSQVAKYVNQSRNMQFLIPSQVIAALSLELHYKTLFYLEKKQDYKKDGRYSHDFYSLYNSLSKESKKEIEEEFDIAIRNRDMKNVRLMEKHIKKRISVDFSENLKIWSTIFTKARYIYEGKARDSMMFFPELENAVVSRIKKIRR